MMKTIFWNVDTQYDFMREDGALPVPGAIEIEANLALLTKVAESCDMTVINTGDWHNKDSKEFSDKPNYKTTFPPHCIRATRGAFFVSATQADHTHLFYNDVVIKNKKEVENALVECRNIILYKDDTDAFKNNPYPSVILDILKPDRVFIYGVAAEVCVNHAIQGLLSKVKEVYAVEDAIKGLDKTSETTHWVRWHSQGVKRILTADVRNMFDSLKE